MLRLMDMVPLRGLLYMYIVFNIDLEFSFLFFLFVSVYQGVACSFFWDGVAFNDNI